MTLAVAFVGGHISCLSLRVRRIIRRIVPLGCRRGRRLDALHRPDSRSDPHDGGGIGFRVGRRSVAGRVCRWHGRSVPRRRLSACPGSDRCLVSCPDTIAPSAWPPAHSSPSLACSSRRTRSADWLGSSPGSSDRVERGVGQDPDELEGEATSGVEHDSSKPAGVPKGGRGPTPGMDVTVTRTVRDGSGAVVHRDAWFSRYRRIDGLTIRGGQPA